MRAHCYVRGVFWFRYGGVVGWLFVVGVALGAVFMFVIFGWLIPPDRGEESVIFAMPFFGAGLGALSALAASVGYWIGMALWARRSGRSVAFRAWTGGFTAGIGVAAFWIFYGLALSGGYGLVVWIPIAVICGAIALAVAGPLTARAARRADTAVAADGSIATSGS